MHNLIYISSAITLLSEDELAAILEKAHSNNDKYNLSGMLLYFDGNFIQVLEGEKANIDKIFAKIKLDKRHTGIIVLDEHEIEERSFAEWSMGFKAATLANIQDIPGYENVTSAGFIDKLKGSPNSYAKEVLTWFHENMNK